jgi:phosphatidylglycerophosphate synthase
MTSTETMNLRDLSPADVRRIGQPAAVLTRRNAEHWAGLLYLRKISPYLTWLFLRTPFSPDGVTWLMIVAGLAGVVALAAGGLWSAIVAVLLVNLYLLLDCCDGELARVKQQFGVAGIYLDRVGHYVVEGGLVAALGVRAQGGLVAGDVVGGWAELGAFAALGAVLIKAETDLVDVARLRTGRTASTDEDLAPRSGTVSTLRRVASLFRLNRLILAMELSTAALLVGIYDTVAGGLAATRVLLVVCACIAAVFAVLHLASVLLSRRLT